MRTDNPPIQAAIFDMGGTLEDIHYDDASQRTATRELHALLCELGLDPGLDLQALQATVLSGMKAYQQWREQTEIELPPERVWAEYVFSNYGLVKDRLMAAAEKITFFFETHYYTRTLRAEAPDALAALHERGLRLGIISNIISHEFVPTQLVEYGIAHYFDPVVTSAVFGLRKPNTQIFLEAARRLNLPPAACAYVGDTISRDVIGARRAGYGLAIQIKSFLTDKADRDTEPIPPDAVIDSLMQIIPIVAPNTEAIYDNQGHLL
jgi:putative hydrolase of the HAD superfamily